MKQLLKIAPPSYASLHDRILFELTNKGTNRYEWKALLIGIDGLDGSGKTSLASWLAWQFGMPAVYLDTFLHGASAGNLRWRASDLKRIIKNRMNRKSPRSIVVEGICLLQVLDEIEMAPNFMVYVKEKSNEGSFSLRDDIEKYNKIWQPSERADYTLEWTAGPF